MTRRIKKPHVTSLVINILIIDILKKEFDNYRNKNEIPPLFFKEKKIVSFYNPKIESWKNNFIGLKFHHKKINLVINSNINDIYYHLDLKKNIVIDFKNTSKKKIFSLQIFGMGIGDIYHYLNFYQKKIT